jgi:hypothetical protein
LDTLKEHTPRAEESFIVNTQPMSDPKVGHWVAVRVTPDSVEYYNPFGKPPAAKMRTVLKRIIRRGLRRGAPPLQFKINRMQDQSITSQNCGWFSMKFLDDRAAGKPFKEATGFNKLGEKQVEKYKQKYKEFGYI